MTSDTSGTRVQYHAACLVDGELGTYADIDTRAEAVNQHIEQTGHEVVKWETAE